MGPVDEYGVWMSAHKLVPGGPLYRGYAFANRTQINWHTVVYQLSKYCDRGASVVYLVSAEQVEPGVERPSIDAQLELDAIQSVVRGIQDWHGVVTFD